jgi:hypothetical protein
MTERKARGLEDVRTGTFTFQANGRALTMDLGRLAKMSPAGRRILGAHILGPGRAFWPADRAMRDSPCVTCLGVHIHRPEQAVWKPLSRSTARRSTPSIEMFAAVAKMTLFG